MITKKLFVLLAIILTFSNCRENSYNSKDEIKDSELVSEEKSTISIDGVDNTKKTDVEVGSDEWKRKAKIYLELEEGETYIDKGEKLNPKNPNKVIYSTSDIEYSEEWRERMYKVTKEHLKILIPQSLPNCYINSFGYYNPLNVHYIGNNTFRVKIYLTIKCGNDDYENRKYFWFETGYSARTNEFDFLFIKERFAD